MVRVWIGGQPCRFYSDDPDEYIAALEQRTNEVMKEIAGLNHINSVLFLTDRLLRAEQKEREDGVPEAAAEEKQPRKKPAKAVAEEKGNRKSAAKAVPDERAQVSMWDLLGNPNQE